MLERQAAETYRRLAGEAPDSEAEQGLLRAAENEDGIANLLEELDADYKRVEDDLRSRFPRLDGLFDSVLNGRPYEEQLRLQQAAELGAAALFKSLAHHETVGHARQKLLDCAGIREEDDMAAAIRSCGGKMGYFHACGSQRGIPGKDLVPWVDALTAVRDVGYDNCITVESFHPGLSIAPLVAVWRHFAESPEVLATEGLSFLQRMHGEIWRDAAR